MKPAHLLPTGRSAGESPDGGARSGDGRPCGPAPPTVDGIKPLRLPHVDRSPGRLTTARCGLDRSEAATTALAVLVSSSLYVLWGASYLARGVVGDLVALAVLGVFVVAAGRRPRHEALWCLVTIGAVLVWDPEWPLRVSGLVWWPAVAAGVAAYVWVRNQRLSSRRLQVPWARWILAGLLVAMAAGQLSDFAGFARLLAGYRLIPDGLHDATAATFVGAEAAAAALLLARRRRGGTLALGVALAWSLLAVQAFARGLTIDNCGCFGVHLGQSLGWWILLEDAEFVALAFWVRQGDARLALPGGASAS